MNWQFASPDEYLPICQLFQSSKLGNGFIDIRRRVTIPLFLRQIVTFYEGSKLCGFVTFAYLSDDAESHMATTGIYPTDWRSGKNFWIVDYAMKNGNGLSVLRALKKSHGITKVKFFRHKYKQVREVKCLVAA